MKIQQRGYVNYITHEQWSYRCKVLEIREINTYPITFTTPGVFTPFCFVRCRGGEDEAFVLDCHSKNGHCHLKCGGIGII